MLWRVVEMRMIHDGRGAGVEGFQAPGQLAPENVVGLIVGTLEDSYMEGRVQCSVVCRRT